MNNFFKLFLFISIGIVIASCSGSDSDTTETKKDFSEQYEKDIDSIDQFIDTHFMTVDADFNVTFTEIEPGGTELSIRNQTDYPLQFKTVTSTDEEDVVDYKVYYLKIREGNALRPTSVDSAYVSYEGRRLDKVQFDNSPTPLWFQLQAVIQGWSEIIPLFKSGTFDTTVGPNPTQFADFGVGVLFVPSGLAYFNAIPSALIPQYSPLIFSFKLKNVRYRDHDRDGILSKDEVNPSVPNQKPEDYDSDSDTFANMYDVDDDGDNYMTKNEIVKNPDGTLIFPDTDGDGIPNYLDKDNH
jgi:FKBP-type peptidyl-prolyl cis-trans isomerase FkpA